MKVIVHGNKFRRLVDTLKSCADHFDVYQVEITASGDDLTFDFMDEDGNLVFNTIGLKEA